MSFQLPSKKSSLKGIGTKFRCPSRRNLQVTKISFPNLSKKENSPKQPETLPAVFFCKTKLFQRTSPLPFKGSPTSNAFKTKGFSTVFPATVYASPSPFPPERSTTPLPSFSLSFESFLKGSGKTFFQKSFPSVSPVPRLPLFPLDARGKCAHDEREVFERTA